MNNIKSIKQISRENVKKFKKQLAKSMINPYCFFDRRSHVGININVDSHNINHANSKLTFKLNFPDLGIETRYIKKN